MKVYFASDHAGFELKETLVHFLRERGYDVEDCGPYTLNTQDDFPELVRPVASKVLEDIGSLGIVIGGSGQGEAIVLNRIKGIRTTVYYGGQSDVLRVSREHNNANVLSLGARFIESTEAKNAVLLWLTTDFSHEERHERRINQIDA